MTWYDDLYVGESIVHKTKKIKWKICHNAGQINIYVITLASNGQNLLDIIPAPGADAEGLSESRTSRRRAGEGI